MTGLPTHGGEVRDDAGGGLPADGAGGGVRQEMDVCDEGVGFQELQGWGVRVRDR